MLDDTCSALLSRECTGYADFEPVADLHGHACCGDCARVLVEWTSAVVRHDDTTSYVPDGEIPTLAEAARREMARVDRELAREVSP